MESKTKTILNELNNSFLIIYEQFWIYFLFMVKLISSCRFKTPQMYLIESTGKRKMEGRQRGKEKYKQRDRKIKRNGAREKKNEK